MSMKIQLKKEVRWETEIFSLEFWKHPIETLPTGTHGLKEAHKKLSNQKNLTYGTLKFFYLQLRP